MEFKGTKGNREYAKSNTGSYIILVDNNYIGSFRNEYDALLDSKAPEMLEMLENLKSLFPKNYSVRLGIERLIKEATTI